MLVIVYAEYFSILWTFPWINSSFLSRDTRSSFARLQPVLDSLLFRLKDYQPAQEGCTAISISLPLRDTAGLAESLSLSPLRPSSSSAPRSCTSGAPVPETFQPTSPSVTSRLCARAPYTAIGTSPGTSRHRAGTCRPRRYNLPQFYTRQRRGSRIIVTKTNGSA